MRICSLFNALFLFFVNYNFVVDVMYITPHLHVVKDSWNFFIMFNRFFIFLDFKFHNFQTLSVFWVWMIN
jgi:hypothetical protein